MKTKKLLLLGVSMMLLAACSGESEEANGESEEGMGTLSAESEEGTESERESENATDSDSESTDDSYEESSHDSGLLDLSDTEEGWLNFEGDIGENSEYRITPEVDYNPETDYEINNGAYISYYNGDEFIKTVLQNETGAIEQVEEADNIRLSFHNSFEDRISLTEK